MTSFANCDHQLEQKDKVYDAYFMDGEVSF